MKNKYKSMKVIEEVHKNIKTEALKRDITISQYLEQLTQQNAKLQAVPSIK